MRSHRPQDIRAAARVAAGRAGTVLEATEDTPTLKEAVSLMHADSSAHRMSPGQCLCRRAFPALVALALIALVIAPSTAVSAATPAPKPPQGVTVRSVDGTAVVTFRKSTGSPTPLRYVVTVDGIEDHYDVFPGMRLQGLFSGLTLGQTYTARVTAFFDGFPSTTSTAVFTPKPSPAMPSVKVSYGLGQVSFTVNVNEVSQPAPVHGWIIRFKGQEIFSRNGRGTVTGQTSGSSCNQYELYTVYDLGAWVEGRPAYFYSPRRVSAETICPYTFAKPLPPVVAPYQIRDGFLYLTFERHELDFVEVASVLLSNRTYRVRPNSSSGVYSFRIKLRAGFSCRDSFVVSLTNRLGAGSVVKTLGHAPEPDEDPATCLAPGQTHPEQELAAAPLSGAPANGTKS